MPVARETPRVRRAAPPETLARPPWSPATLRLIEAAADEDLGQVGDVTAALLEDAQRPALARLVPRQAGVACGLALLDDICRVFGARLGGAPRPKELARDGDPVAAGAAIAELRGPRGALLGVERTLLNFVSRMSGVATLTRRFVTAASAANPAVRIYDTRKTLPGWRELDRYAVRCGGGSNHRDGLHDAVLIKDNHLAGTPPGRLAQAGRRPAFVEVEVDTLDQFEQVCCTAGVDIVLLDNFAADDLRRAVARRDALGLAGRVQLEASGGVTLETIAAVAASGVERIAIGALTHSATGLDLGLDFAGE
jgi:nicotinate-nucleotide pyrophosphorylase (carboxylating)